MYLPDLTLPSELVRYQVCFHLSCFSLPYLLLPTYMPDKPDIYLLQGTTLMPKQPNCIPTWLHSPIRYASNPTPNQDTRHKTQDKTRTKRKSQMSGLGGKTPAGRCL